ncbi:DsbA family protein [Leptolyngbya boryana CZ1]|uniref:DsbA family protein n=1 Tax=Leptolyngbya boryana CZ1 TaxID=3060204 RepID=A0AA96WPD9_LEPBY|nr:MULTISPECIES: DsbA family protein [Leptolyngbya]MBD1855973.1 DsbA family protein [Leptolyngbya sp. FACHB-1624]WNZ43258.1 DsbA family protein [Leptolyngbya boryana CZ1]
MASSREPNCLTLPVSDRDHCQGSSIAKVTLVEYGDYQCPHCWAAQQIIPLIQQQLGEQIRFVFRHFPRSSLHPEAYHAAEAAEAAASQSKFWEMHSYLFHHQAQLADSDLVRYAIALCLNVDQFLAEMTSDRHMARVQEDIKSGIQSSVIKTPTFFINGIKHGDDDHLETLLEAVVKAERNC